MIGAIAGDMFGSIYERSQIKHKDFQLLMHGFTDDTILTIAVANAILNGSDVAESLKAFAQIYPFTGYGRTFRRWMWAWENKPYNSFGNGSAMRVSPVGFAFDSMDEVLLMSKWSAETTHNHPEGIKGAQAVVLAIWMARQGAGKEAIRHEITHRFGYDLDRTLDQIRPSYQYNSSCQGSVPESIIAFLDSDCYEDAIKNAISLGGDADTMACITGGIAQAFYKKIPDSIVQDVREKLPGDLLEVLDRFNHQYKCTF